MKNPEPDDGGSKAEKSTGLADIDLLLHGLRADTGAAVRGVILYGSRLSNANPDRHSAIDLLLVVDSYKTFYKSLARAGQRPYWGRFMHLLSHVLPPNVIAYRPKTTEPTLAKCLVLSWEHFSRAMGPRATDHFVLCRMIQWVEVVYAATDEERDALTGAITMARRRSVDWVVPYLRDPVDELGYARRMMEICYRGEVRPETKGRASSLVEAQAPYLRRVFGTALRQAAAEGELVRRDGLYCPSDSVTPSNARRWVLYFHASRLRASARWIKHMVTFDDWVGYLVRKAERHSGQSITLTRLERDWPMIFIWPRAIRFLWERSRRERTAQVRRATEELQT